MREQIRRILELVHAGRLSSTDAAPLLAALHPKLNLSEDALAPLFALLVAEGFGPERVSDILFARTDPPKAAAARGGPTSPPPGMKGGWLGNLGNLGNFDGMVERITDTVERAFDGSPAASRSTDDRGAPRAGTVLRIEIEDENGGNYNANLPLSLAAHIPKMLPAHALKSLEHAGMSAESLQLILENNPPVGPLLSAEDQNGNSVQLSVK
ncbi:hypothetical protein [Deinococcus sp.]|uniref:hypothetical protein n=1 Tax=Deinococcus sp. TaxID=47478 RepID=UPI0025FB4847|nr:hypothetical protein [Deinococcus sp.]